MIWHALGAGEVLKKIGSSFDGLDAGEIRKREKKFGLNVLREYKKKSWIGVFFRQFNSMLIWILIIAALISGLMGHLVDAVVIGAIVVLNGVIGFVQEYKAEEIIEKLKANLKYGVLVLRDGKQVRIDSEEIVPGDVLVLGAGDKVLADCRILKCEDFYTNEAVLTGESLPVGKETGILEEDVVLAERKNMIYAGTSVARGRGLAVVVNTGHRTEFGKLAEQVQKTKNEITPLEKKVNLFSKRISFIVLGLVAVIFGVGVFEGQEFIEMFLVAVSLAIGAIPEGLPAIIAISLAFAVTQMNKVNVLIRKLPAAETLGRATVICTDKTGTLTEEKLTVDEVWSEKVRNRKRVLEIGILCNNARDEGDNILGDPTEVAIVDAAKKEGFDKKKLTEANPRVREYVFDSERKMMSIIRQAGRVKTSYVKGAPNEVLLKCTQELVDGKVFLLSKKRRNELSNIYRDMERRGLRVLGMAYRTVRGTSQREAEERLIFVGFAGMIDPPRAEVASSIKEALEAGIKVKVITGDSALTTAAIADKIGLHGDMIEGRELGKLSEKDWINVVKDKTIFARVTPQQKLKIVDTLKALGEVVAVTGDGVNDILALKRADIGVAMGKRGSDVARDGSDMVLLDDNFASIVKAVRQGRRVFDNLKKSIKFLLVANAGEVLIVLAGLVMGLPLIFLPLAILWMNLVTDSLPALSLAMEPVEKNAMKRGPKDEKLLEGILVAILFAGGLMLISCLMIFNYGMNNGGIEIARTMAVSTAIFFELFFTFSCKSERSLFKTGIFNNMYLIWAILVSAGLHLILIYSPLNGTFGMSALSLKHLGIALFTGLNGLVLFEGWKIVDEWKHRRKSARR